MNSSIISIACVLFSLVIGPNTDFIQDEVATGPAVMEISVTDSKSGKQYNGTVSSVTIHHAEQDVLEVLKKNKTLSFISPNGSNKALNTFLSEEEYLNIMTIKVNGKTASLKGVSLTQVNKASNGLMVTVRFKSVR